MIITRLIVGAGPSSNISGSKFQDTDGETTPTSLTPQPSFSNFQFSDNFRSPPSRVACPIGSPLELGSPPAFDHAGDAALPFQDQIDNKALRFNLPDEMKAPFVSFFSEKEEEPRCQGQWVDWYPGSIWDTYAYQQHEHKLIPWTLIGIEGGHVRLQSKACKKYLTSNVEMKRAVCLACSALLRSPKLCQFMERASGDAEPHTPWMYLNFFQIRKLIVGINKRIKRLELQV